VQGANIRYNPPAVRRICLFVFCLTLALTAGQGLVRFRHVLGATGQQFLDLNDYDALAHATIAQRILDGQGYTLPASGQKGRQGESEPAFGKAPGYPYSLAGLFRITGLGARRESGIWRFPFQKLDLQLGPGQFPPKFGDQLGFGGRLCAGIVHASK
jgi:hypothetical protein